MSSIDDVLQAIPMDRLAAQLGTDRETTEQATRIAMPALLGGMQANAQDPAGAASLERAVGKHDPGLVEGGVDLDQVDADDGDKIVGHVFGPKRDEVVNRLGGGKVDSSMVAKLLPLLAPIVMSYLAKQAGQRSTVPGGGGGGLGDVLGSVLGRGGGKAGGLDIGDVLGGLGGLLGGGRR